MGHVSGIQWPGLLLMVFHAASQAEVSTIGDLDKLQGERFYYEAKAAANKAKRQAEMLPGTTPAENSAPGAGGRMARAETLPALVKVSGRKAVLMLSEGTTTTVTPGQLIQGGRYQVQSISLNGVTVRRITDGRTFPLN